MTDSNDSLPLSATDFHVLLVLAADDLYGYAILKAVEAESEGAVSPEIGSLYRVLARLVEEGLVAEARTPEDAPRSTRGRPRKYYTITPEGLSALRAESSRLAGALDLARVRLAGEAAP